VQAIDTNVIVRLLVHDDKEQGRRAEAIFRQALDAGGVWLAQIVFVEVAWVLRSAYKFDRNTISSVLRSLLETEGVTVEEAPLVLSGLTAFETGEADFADYVILERARHAQALPLWTFDGRLAQADGAARVP
jgi:predicted nucleic-acid-binding protein